MRMHRMLLRAVGTLIVAGIAVSGRAALGQALEPGRIDVSALGPQVGEIVPDFSLPDQRGQIQTRASIMGPTGAMLVFVRSADW